LTATVATGAIVKEKSCQNLAISLSRNGTATPLPVDLTLGLSVLTGSGTFYNDSVCTAPITQTALPAGFTSRTVYFKPLRSVSTPVSTIPLITPNLNSTASGGFGFSVAGAPYIATMPVTGYTSSGVSCTGLTVSLVDQNGDSTSSTSSVPITFSATGDLRIFSDSTCTTPLSSSQFAAGTSTITLYHRTVNACSGGSLSFTTDLDGTLASAPVVGFTTSQGLGESCGCD
jgi:hypothetical protein